ncbi:RNA polymerase sigma-70 factor (ECF subfamily) [Georgenia soli]|uniref:RNA polymerase sigma-70 factor (ECF subfamily) n=1 Tax=Georgenia soli TaxID=638953 RepID=A0A2A9EP26_9MICO|nr:sigma-70 family RNA polymerase sigma factor [Georgenia soli]PFG40012.1 RNA polymerase sigma-70 factor (ECF subfamily) [Georgenia soli]
MVDRGPAEAALEQAWREHWGRLMALLLARFRRVDIVEDALADAFAEAADRWPRDGAPANPPAWLHTAARRRCVDRLRTEAVAARKVPLLAVPEESPVPEPDDESHILDERLRLVLTCCHPALAPDVRAALTLRFVLGLPTREIARLFLVPEATMAARLTRAKKKIVAARIPFAVPGPDQLEKRLAVATAVVYLVFTAGYAPGDGPDAVRIALAGEAVRLGRLLDELMPGRAPVRALLALMVLQHARRDARTDAEGRLVLLPDQDRRRWRHVEIQEGLRLLASVPPSTGQAEEYRLQALVAAEHARATRASDTDWRTIARTYSALDALTGSPVVRLNRAVAVAEADGPAAGLELLDGLEESLPGSHRVALVRGELLARLGRTVEAATALGEAADRCANDAERRHILARRDAVAAATDAAGPAENRTLRATRTP